MLKKPLMSHEDKKLKGNSLSTNTQQVRDNLHIFLFRLKSDLQTRTAEKSELESQISDLRSHVQKYVTEVKRIEELLASREKERIELLQQYKHLSGEMDSVESYGRKMAAKVKEYFVAFLEQCFTIRKNYWKFNNAQ